MKKKPVVLVVMDGVGESADELGTPGSSSVPVTMAWKCARTPPRERRMLLAGFGGGLSASVGSVVAGADCEFFVFDYGG